MVEAVLTGSSLLAFGRSIGYGVRIVHHSVDKGKWVGGCRGTGQYSGAKAGYTYAQTSLRNFCGHPVTARTGENLQS